LSNLAGQRTDAYGYDVFGAQRAHTGTASQSFTFTGEQMDGELGLVFLRARYYDPKLARFVSKDPFTRQISKPNSLNPFVYSLNNPISNSDPIGMFSWPDSYGSFVEASGQIGPVGAAIALDIDIPASEFRLSINFLGALTPAQAGTLIQGSIPDPDWSFNGKAVSGVYAGSAGDTNLGVDAFYGQGLIAGGSVNHGEGSAFRAYAGAGIGDPISVGGSQTLNEWRLSGENYTFQRAIGTVMPLIPLTRWAIVQSRTPLRDWQQAWNLANPAFGIPDRSGKVSGLGTISDWNGPPGQGK